MCFEVRAPSSTSPPSPRRISNQLTCPPRTPTQGTSTEDLGQIQPGVPNSSLNQYNLSQRQHKHHLTKRGRPLAKQPQSTSSLRGIYNQSPPLTRGSKPQSQPLTRGSQPPLQINLYPRGIQQIGGLQSWWSISTTNNFSHK